MDPKDLKNSEELKSNVPIDPKQLDEAATTPDTKENKETSNELGADKEEKATGKKPSKKKAEEKKPEVAKETPVEKVEEKEPEKVTEEKAKVTETPAVQIDEEKSEEVAPPAENIAPEKDKAQETEEKAVEQVKEVAQEVPKKEEEEAPEPKAEEVELPEKKAIDYSKLSQIELVNTLRDLLEDSDKRNIKSDIEAIKSNFYKLANIRAQENKEEYLKSGGLEEDYVAEKDPYEQDIKGLLNQFRQQRIELNKKLEQDKEENLKEKYEIIEQIKNLINNEESINKTFHDFRELQNRWREIGPIPQAKMKNLWDTYHFHVENFYDYIKINKELRDLDLRKNLELKIVLCEKAEQLLTETSIIRAFNTLQKYHEEWREIGPVPREKKEEIWERFKAATSLINKKHQEFFENRKTEQKANLESKTALCEQAEEIANSEINGHKDWDEKSRALIKLQKVWRTIGFAPKRDNNRIYERFRNACDKFFESKREFYASNKELQQNNYQLKIDLCVQAEALKDSEDWKKTTQEFINIQKKWKEIGPVPRKHSDLIWKRFRAACDYFFEKKSMHFSSVDGNQLENLAAKEKLVQEVIDFKPSGDMNADLEDLKGFQRRWTEIGHVPIKKKDALQSQFREVINKHFDDLNLDDSKRNMLKFRNRVSNFSESYKGQNKMRYEREKYMTKLKQMEGDLVLLENNIGFFSNSKNAESLIADVNKKIEQTKEKIEFLKNKIRILDEYDGEE